METDPYNANQLINLLTKKHSWEVKLLSYETCIRYYKTNITIEILKNNKLF